MRVFASFAASTAPRAARWTRAVFFENARTAARSTGPERRGAERDDREGLRLAERRDDAVDLLREGDAVGPGRHHRPARAGTPGVLLLLLQLRRVRGRVAEVPGDAREARLRRGGQPPDDVPRLVGDGQEERRLLLAVLGAEVVPRRVDDVLPLLRLFLLRLLARLLPALQVVLQVRREDRPERRVRGGVERLAEERLPLEAVRHLRDVGPRVADREEDRLLRERLRRREAERRDVVEDPEAAAERRDDEVALALLEGEVADVDRRHPALELDPLLPAVVREEETELRPAVEEARLLRVLGHGVDRPARGEVPGDRGPGLPAVRALQEVGLEVAPLVVVEGRVDDVRLVRRGREVGDVGHLRDAGEGRHLPPAPAAVLRHLDEPVVRPGVDEVRLLRALDEGDDVSVERRRGVLGDRVDAPDAPHDREAVPVDLPRQVGADGLPAVPAVLAPEDPLRREPEPRRRVGRDEERRVPVPAQGRVVRPRLRLDVDLLARLPVEPHEGAVLRLGVDDVGVPRLDGGEEAVAPLRDEPVLVQDAVDVVGPRRAAEGGVVLRAAVDVVEGLRVVDRHPVELRHREVRLELPRRAAVPRLVDAAVVAVQEVVGVLRVDPEGVVVDVLGLLARLAATSSRRRPSPACRCPSSRRGRRPSGRGRAPGSTAPRSSSTRRASPSSSRRRASGRSRRPCRAPRRGRRPCRAPSAGRRGRSGPTSPFGQAVRQLRPGRAAVGRLVDAALGPAVDEREDVPPALVGARRRGPRGRAGPSRRR